VRNNFSKVDRTQLATGGGHCRPKNTLPCRAGLPSKWQASGTLDAGR
jgi:hypothetical protein